MSEKIFKEFQGKALFLDTRHIVLEGDKGFYITIGNRIYIPNRTCSICKGFIKNFKVIRDIEGYSIFEGVNVQSNWTFADMKEFIEKVESQYRVYYPIRYGDVNAVMEIGENTDNLYIDWRFFCKVHPREVRQVLKKYQVNLSA